MTIQEAMHTAIAGGYHMQGADGGEIAFSGANNEYSAWTRTDTQSSFLIPVQETLLDPAFWRKPRQRILYAGAELNRLYPECSISMSNHAV